MKKTLIAGVSAIALMLSATGGAWADDAVSVAVGLAGGDAGTAASSSSLEQNTIQIGIVNTPIPILSNDISFGSQTFQNQVLNNNNFATGTNAVQGGSISIAAGVGSL